MHLLFSQRVNSIVSMGLMPPPQYSDYRSIFEREDYASDKLIDGSIMYLQRSQQLLAELKKQSTVASALFMEEETKLYQRVGTMKMKMMKMKMMMV